MPVAIESVIDNIDDLVSLPDVFLRINSIMASPDYSLEELAQVITRDPGLTTRVLGMANSAAFAPGREIDSIATALTIIGARRLRDLVMATAMIKTFEGIPNELISMENFWSHSIYCGLISQHLGELAGLKPSDTLFVAGLLHDIGMLIMFRRLPELSHQVVQNTLDSVDNYPISFFEQKVIGFDHAQLGMAMAEHWNLPKLYAEVIGYHHQPGNAENFPKETAIVHIANSLSVIAELGTTELNTTDAPPIEATAWLRSGLDVSCINSTVQASQQQFQGIYRLFFGH